MTPLNITMLPLQRLLNIIGIKLSMAVIRFKNIMCYEGNGAVRLLISMGSLTWAALLFDPSTLFTSSRTTYLVMRVMATEQTWAYLFLFSGLFGLFTVLFGVRCKFYLIYDSFLAALVWTTSTLACFAAHWPVTGSLLFQISNYAPPAAMSGEFWLSVAAWWCCIRRVTDSPFIEDILIPFDTDESSPQ